MDIYELSIYEQVSFAEVASIISDLKNVPMEKIGTEANYYNQLADTSGLEIGISIHHQSRDYKSFLQLTLKDEITESEFVKMACQIAKMLNTDVAIGDVTSKSDFAIGEYLIISPDQKYRKAYEKSNDGDIFELNAYTEKTEVTNLFEELGQGYEPILLHKI